MWKRLQSVPLPTPWWELMSIILVLLTILAAWKWSEGKKPDVLKNLVEAYSVPQEIKDLYGEKLHMWKEDS